MPSTTSNLGVVLRPERPADHVAVETLHRIAFGDLDDVPSLVGALRRSTGPLPTVSTVATTGDHVVGHVMLSAGRLDSPRQLVDVFVLSPLAVHPQQRGRGIGTSLIKDTLRTADEMRVPLVFLEGDPGYYATRGFERADVHGFRSPSLRIPEAAFQVAQMTAYEPWMTGTLVYSEIFWQLDCVGLRDSDDA